MTIRSFLESIEIADQTSAARYPDGSGGNDNYMLTVFIDGHGKPLNAKVKNAAIRHGGMFVYAEGNKEKGA